MKIGGKNRELQKRVEMKEPEKQAKLSALKEAHKLASSMMSDSLKSSRSPASMKKVTIASDSKEGLKAGLDKAEDMLGEQSEEECEYCEGEGCPHCAMGEDEKSKSEGYEDEQEESEPMDEDELDAKIEHLMKLKSKLQNS